LERNCDRADEAIRADPPLAEHYELDCAIGQLEKKSSLEFSNVSEHLLLLDFVQLGELSNGRQQAMVRELESEAHILLFFSLAH